ncbi:MAG: hypothetical protein LBI95_00070 [Holosporales bacterium]|jgi:hypothetical protein|nr:hypothetical protein [Holosporales bacterium]
MLLRKFISILSIAFVFLLEGVFETCSGKTATSTNKTEVVTAAENKLKEILPKFIELVSSSANKTQMSDFFKKNLDAAAISKRFCGENNSDLMDAINKLLVWRVNTKVITDAILPLKSYKLLNEMQSTDKGSTISVKCKLKKGEDLVGATVIFTKSGDSILGIKEIIFTEIPLIETFGVPMKRYFEKNKIKINALTPSDRAKKCILALEAFMNGEL